MAQIEQVIVSQEELFQRKVDVLQLRLGEMFYGLFGNVENGGEPGLFHQLGSKLSIIDRKIQGTGAEKLIDRITDDERNIDHVAVVKEGDMLATELTKTSIGDISVILLNSGYLRNLVIETGGILSTKDFNVDLKFSQRIRSGEQTFIQESGFANQELESAFEKYDLNNIVEEIKRDGMNDDNRNRLYVSVLLSSLKSPSVLDTQAIKKLLVDGGKISEKTADIIDGGVLTSQEIKYTKYLLEKKIVQSRAEEGRDIQTYFNETYGFSDSGDAYFETQNEEGENEMHKIVAVANGQTEDLMFAVTDSGFVWRRDDGKWIPVMVTRKGEFGEVSSVATVGDVRKGIVKFVKQEKGKYDLIVEEKVGRQSVVKTVEPVTDSELEDANKAQSERRRKALRAKFIEVAGRPDTQIEMLDRDISVDIIDDKGQKTTVWMVAQTINEASQGLKKLVDFTDIDGSGVGGSSVYRAQGFFDENGRYYTRLARIEEKKGQKNIQFVDLSTKGESVVARSYTRSLPHQTDLMIDYLVDNLSDDGNPLNWVLKSQTFKDGKNDDNEFNLYFPKVEKTKDKAQSGYSDRTMRIINIDELNYSTTKDKPTTSTPTISIETNISEKEKEKSRSFRQTIRMIFSRAAKDEKKEDISEFVAIGVDNDPRRIRQAKSRIRTLIQGFPAIRYYTDEPLEITVFAGDGKMFIDDDGKTVARANVGIYCQQVVDNDVYSIDLRGNIYRSSSLNQDTVPVFVEGRGISHIVDYLKSSI